MVLLPDFSGLHIVALVLGVAHGEGLPGKHAVGHDGFEQLLLAHGGQLEADGARLAAQAVRDLADRKSVV